MAAAAGASAAAEAAGTAANEITSRADIAVRPWRIQAIRPPYLACGSAGPLAEPGVERPPPAHRVGDGLPLPTGRPEGGELCEPAEPVLDRVRVHMQRRAGRVSVAAAIEIGQRRLGEQPVKVLRRVESVQQHVR